MVLRNSSLEVHVYLEKKSVLNYKTPKNFKDRKTDTIAGEFRDALAVKFRSEYE